MTDAEIVKVVIKLVGNINPIADSYYDAKVLENINIMGSVVDTLVCRIGNMIYDNKASKEGSVTACTGRAKEILKTINENISEYLEETQV